MTLEWLADMVMIDFMVTNLFIAFLAIWVMHDIKKLSEIAKDKEKSEQRTHSV